MTPPLKSVNIQSLDTVFPENLMGFKPQEIAKRLAGTKFQLYQNEGKVFLRSQTGESVSLENLINFAWQIRDLDKNKDKYFDLKETQAFFDEYKIPSSTDPQEFLKNLHNLVEGFFNPMAKNMEVWKSELSFTTLFGELRSFNKGLYSAESHRAHGENPLSSKALTNIVFFPGSTAAWGLQKLTLMDEPEVRYLDVVSGGAKTEAPFFLGDQMAQERTFTRYEERKIAIDNFETLVQEGLKNQEDWAMNFTWEGALAKLTEAHPEAVEILTEELALKKHWGIAASKNPTERYQKILELAKGERHGFLGYGGGAAKDYNWFNWTGNTNNYTYARSALQFLGTKAWDPKNEEASAQLQKESNAILEDMLGNGGNTNNAIHAGLCKVNPWCDSVQYKPWSDETAGEFPGRLAFWATVFYGTNKFIKVRRAGGKFLLESPAAEAGMLTKVKYYGGNTLLMPFHALNRTLDGAMWVSGKVFSKIPLVGRLGPAAKEAAKNSKMPAGAQAGLKSVFVDWFLASAAVYHLDQAVYDPPNVNDYDQELDLEAWPDPTLPDPLLEFKDGKLQVKEGALPPETPDPTP